MSWSLSRYRVGVWVEVRPEHEILATLDVNGRLDGMPFMPEMLQFCGQRFRVSAVAHKTCDTVKMIGGRRLSSTVHLAGLRCSGSAHGGCQAECNLFWKDAWLTPVTDGANHSSIPSADTRCGPANEGLRAKLEQCARCPGADGGDETKYVCQATTLLEATELLPWWDIRQYVFDATTGNRSYGRVAAVLWLAILRWLVPRVPFGYRLLRSFSEFMHRWLTGRGSPLAQGQIDIGQPTPTGRLDLKPGELVRIKAQAEIDPTLDRNGKNRGLFFDHREMAPYCGQVFKVRKVVTQIIDEPTGKMRYMKQPCIMLEGVVCGSLYTPCRLNCPRAIPSYWRELWLERVHDPAVQNVDKTDAKDTSAKEYAIATDAS